MIRPGSSDYWEGVVLKVPALAPTHLAGSCSIMDVQYRYSTVHVQYSLQFHVEPSGPAFDLVVKIPIIVGTIPLQQYIPTIAPPPSHEKEVSGEDNSPVASSVLALEEFR